MTVVRRLARPMLASMFLVGGANALRDPGPRAEGAAKIGPKIASVLNQGPGPSLPEDPESLVRINAAIHLGAGTLLALGKFPRLSAAALAATLIPTTYAGHAFWEESEQGAKKGQQVHFFKNLSLLGGLLIAAVDTEGKASLPRKARRAAKTSKRASKSARRELRAQAKAARQGASSAGRRAALASERTRRKGQAKLHAVS